MTTRGTKTIYLLVFLFLCLPFLGFAARGNFFVPSRMNANFILESLKVTATSSTIAMVFIILLGLPTGYFMASGSFKGKKVMDAFFNLPQILPPAVLGLLLLLTFGRNGFLGRFFWFNAGFSVFAVVLTFIFVALPVFIKGVAMAFSDVDFQLIEASILLGATPWEIFKWVTFPLAKKNVASALILSWVRGISEFGATMMFAGNLRGVTQTMPLAIYSALESNLDSALFLSFAMVLFSGGVLLISTFILERG